MPQPRYETIAILGPGLIGASIGLAARERGVAGRVVGVSRRAATCEKAIAVGALTDAADSIAAAVADAGLTIICTPVGVIAQQAVKVAAHCPPGALITDAGSTKGQIVAAVVARRDLLANRRITFVGSHPLAGSEKTGPEHARGDLFQDRVVVVTPTDDDPAERVAELRQFWESLGARVVEMPAPEHDRLLAHASHLPHLVAAVLASTTPQEALELTATGWSDTTRVAAGDPQLWTQIMLSNRGDLLKSLDGFGNFSRIELSALGAVLA